MQKLYKCKKNWRYDFKSLVKLNTILHNLNYVGISEYIILKNNLIYHEDNIKYIHVCARNTDLFNNCNSNKDPRFVNLNLGYCHLHKLLYYWLFWLFVVNGIIQICELNCLSVANNLADLHIARGAVAVVWECYQDDDVRTSSGA